MKLDVIESIYLEPDILLVPLKLCDRETALRAKRTLLVELQGMLNRIRPGTHLCGPQDSTDKFDPACGHANFAVYFAGSLVGAWNIYNGSEGQRGADHWGFMACPGVEAFPGMSLGESWGHVMRGLIGKRLVIAGRDDITISRWRFPQVAGEEWVGDPIAAEAVAMLEPVSRNGDGTPVCTL